VAFVDITDLSRQLGGESVMLAEDGLHPSATMYTLWHQRAFEVTRVLWAEPTR
jgi:lysophospholipase L1-like esterase